MNLNIKLLEFELEEFNKYKKSGKTLEKYFQNYNKNEDYKNKINNEYIYEICHITKTKLFKYDKINNQIVLSKYSDTNSNETIKNQIYKDYKDYMSQNINNKFLGNLNKNINKNEIDDFILFKQKRMEETIFYLKKDYNNKLKNNLTNNSNNNHSNNSTNITTEEKEKIENDFYFQHFSRTEEEKKEKLDEINSYDKRKVYIINGEQFKSKYEAKIYHNYILPLQLNYGIEVRCQERYDKLADTKSQHTMDFFLPELNLLIEATNYTQNWNIGLKNKGQEYLYNIKFKKNILDTNNLVREPDKKIDFLLITQNGNKDFNLSYNLNESQLIEILEQKIILMKKERILNHPSYLNNPTEEVKQRLETNYDKILHEMISDMKLNEKNNLLQESSKKEKTHYTLTKILNMDKEDDITLFKKMFSIDNKNLNGEKDKIQTHKEENKINNKLSNFDFKKIKEGIIKLNEELNLFLQTIDKNDKESINRINLKIKHNQTNLNLITNYENFLKNILSLSLISEEKDKDKKLRTIIEKYKNKIPLNTQNITIFLTNILNLNEILPLIYEKYMKKSDIKDKLTILLKDFSNDLKEQIFLLMKISEKSVIKTKNDLNHNQLFNQNLNKQDLDKIENNFSFDFY